MVTSAVFIALLGTINLKPAISAAISSEPIQITVNENFNVPPGQVSREFQSHEPGAVHQGANFYFKPKFTLPSSSVPQHIQALISLIQQHHSCAQDATKEIFENKLMEILKPFMYANPKETLTDIVLEEENTSKKNTKPSSTLITEKLIPPMPELLVIPEAPALPPLSFNDITPLVKEELKKEELEAKSVREEPIVIEIEPKPVASEYVLIPEAPVLPPFSADEMRIIEKVKIEELKTVPESIVVDIESKPATPELLVISEAPVLPPLSFNDISAFVVEEVKKEESEILEETKGVSEELIVIEIEPKPVTPEHLVIPEAPVLPPLSYSDSSAFIKEGVKNEESVLLEKAQGVSEEPIVIEVEPKPVTPEHLVIPEAPVLPPLPVNGIRIVGEVKIEEPNTVPESIVVDIESKPSTPELFMIPEAPVLPPLSYNDVSAFVEEGIKKEESVILEKAKGVSEEPIVVEVEPKPVAPELVLIPEAPMLQPLSFNDISALVEEEEKKEESVILEKTKSVPEEPIVIEIEPKPTAPELVLIPEAPVLPPFSADEMRIIEEVKIEELKTVPESIVVDIESKPATPEVLVIPEAPVLPPLSFDDISAFVEEEVKKEESIILEETKRVSEEPVITVVALKPTAPKLQVIPEAPVLPPLSYNGVSAFVEEGIKKEESVILEKAKVESEKPIVIEVEPKPVALEHLIIPEAPVLPPLSYNDVSSFVEERIKKEESVILEKAKGVSEEPIAIEVEPKPVAPELVLIPEAPMLPPLSFNDISAFVDEEVKKEESVILEKTKSVPEEPIVIEIEPKPAAPELVLIPEAPVLPPFSADEMRIIEEVKIEELKTVPESIIVDIESKPATPEVLVIPEAPVLPPLSFDDIGAFVEEEVKKEESVILEETKGVSEEPVITVVALKPTAPKLQVIPEAPVLQPLSYNDVSAFVEEGIKKEESVILEKAKSESEEPIVIEVESKPVALEHLIIPEAPVLPSLPVNGIRIVEEVKIEEPSTVPESIVVDIESKPLTPELFIIPEAPVLPPLSYNDVSAFVEEGIKKEESVILEKAKGVSEEPIAIEVEPKPVAPELVLIPEAPMLLPLSFNDISAFVEEEVKKEESVILEETKGVSEEPLVIEIEPKPVAPEHLVIPEAPMVQPLPFNDISAFVEKEVKNEESVILEETKVVSEELVIPVVALKPAAPELLVIPEALMLQPLPFNDISAFVEEEVKKEESVILEKAKGVSEEPIVIEIEPKLEHVVIPEPPVLPLQYNGISSIVEDEVKEKSVLLKESIRVFPSISDVVARQETLYVEPKPAIQELVIIPEAPVLPSMSDITAIEEVKSEETIMSEEFTDKISETSARQTLGSTVETETAESYALEDSKFPVAAEELKLEIPILLEESIEVFPPIAVSSRPTLQEHKMSDTYVLEKDSQPNSERLAKKTFPPTIIRPSKPSNNLGLFNYAPFLSHLSNHASKTKQVMFPKPASLERFLLKKHPLRLPVTPFPKLSLNAVTSPFLENTNQFLYPTAYAHDVVEKRIAPNMAFKNNAPPKRVKIFIRSNVPKESS